MFLMKNFKLIFLFLLIIFSISCTNNLKDNKIKYNFKKTSDYGRFLSTKYSLKLGQNEIASNIISKSKNLHLDLTLAELNFNSYLINGDFEKAKKFKLIAPSKLNESPMYDLPDFVIGLKNGKFLTSDNFNFLKNELPGFKIIFEKLEYIELVESANYKNFIVIIHMLDICS